LSELSDARAPIKNSIGARRVYSQTDDWRL